MASTTRGTGAHMRLIWIEAEPTWKDRHDIRVDRRVAARYTRRGGPGQRPAPERGELKSGGAETYMPVESEARAARLHLWRPDHGGPGPEPGPRLSCRDQARAWRV